MPSFVEPSASPTIISAASAGTTFRPNSTYTTLRDVTGSPASRRGDCSDSSEGAVKALMCSPDGAAPARRKEERAGPRGARGRSGAESHGSSNDGKLLRVTRELDVRPHDGVGPLRLGMTRSECRAAFGEECEEFRKLADDERTTDQFLSAVHVYYDDEDRAEYIEVTRVSDVRPIFGDVAVLEVEPSRAVAAVARRAPYDRDDPELGFSYIFKQLDLSLWRPVDDEQELEGQTFMTVGVGRPGYYA